MAIDIGSYTEGITAGLSPSGPLGTVAIMVIVGLAVGVVGYMIWVLMSYNVKVTVFCKTQTTSYEKHLKGKFYVNKENGQTYFKTTGKVPAWNQPLPLDYLIISVVGKRLVKKVYFAENDQGKFQPMKPITNDDLMVWTGWKNSDQEFAIGHARRMIEFAKKGDFWAKYGTLIQMGFMALMVVMLIVLFRQLDGVVGGLESVANTLGEFKVISAGNNTQVFS